MEYTISISVPDIDFFGIFPDIGNIFEFPHISHNFDFNFTLIGKRNTFCHWYCSWFVVFLLWFWFCCYPLNIHGNLRVLCGSARRCCYCRHTSTNLIYMYVYFCVCYFFLFSKIYYKFYSVLGYRERGWPRKVCQ